MELNRLQWSFITRDNKELFTQDFIIILVICLPITKQERKSKLDFCIIWRSHTDNTDKLRELKPRFIGTFRIHKKENLFYISCVMKFHN